MSRRSDVVEAKALSATTLPSFSKLGIAHLLQRRSVPATVAAPPEVPSVETVLSVYERLVQNKDKLITYLSYAYQAWFAIASIEVAKPTTRHGQEELGKAEKRLADALKNMEQYIAAAQQTASDLELHVAATRGELREKLVTLGYHLLDWTNLKRKTELLVWEFVKKHPEEMESQKILSQEQIRLLDERARTNREAEAYWGQFPFVPPVNDEE